MKQFQVVFDPQQIKNAALFLERHNTLCRQSSTYWEDSIYETIKESCAKEDVMWSGTGGYLVIFSQEEDGTVIVDVNVDPSVGHPKHYTESSYAFGKIIKEF